MAGAIGRGGTPRSALPVGRRRGNHKEDYPLLILGAGEGGDLSQKSSASTFARGMELPKIQKKKKRFFRNSTRTKTAGNNHGASDSHYESGRALKVEKEGKCELISGAKMGKGEQQRGDVTDEKSLPSLTR